MHGPRRDIAEPHSDTVFDVAFSRDGTLLAIFGQAGPGDGEFNHPHGLALDRARGDLLYVGDQEKLKAVPGRAGKHRALRVIEVIDSQPYPDEDEPR